MKNSYRIAEISIGSPTLDTRFSFEIEGQTFEVERFGTNYSIELVKDRIQAFQNEVDAISITGFPPEIHLNGKSYIHKDLNSVLRTPSNIPLCTGHELSNIAVTHGVDNLIKNQLIDVSQGVFFPSGLLCLDAVKALQEVEGSRLFYGDAYSIAKIPKLISHFDGISKYSKLALGVGNYKALSGKALDSTGFLGKSLKNLFFKQLEKVENVFAHPGFLVLFGEDLDFINSKNIILPYSHQKMEDKLKKYSPQNIFNIFPEKYLKTPYMNYPVLDAALRLAAKRNSHFSVHEIERILNIDDNKKISSRRYVLNNKESASNKINKVSGNVKRFLAKKDAPDFAFVVHALSHRDLARVPGLGFLNHMPREWDFTIEKSLSQLPGFAFGRIDNIISKATGKRTTGLIYALMSTPKVMKEAAPELTYNKIEKLCQHAADQGAKIIGLGAYTKVVGDSGETVNRLSPIPVTTGNSLSASATLWAVREAVLKMGLLKIDPNSGRVKGTATVIGATGAIGSVSAKLLSLVFEEVCLVAPRAKKLQEMALELKHLSPSCRVKTSTDANDFACSTDVLVTATSAVGQKIVDIMQLKPGCVVCDCSRPLDFSIEDSIKRPDVLIIESGEVILPGPYNISCDLGLPGKLVYACLAETAVLAMEERYECFTLGRNLDWNKVKEIYKLSIKHGVTLAGIRGHAGFIYDKEIELVTKIALEKRKTINHSAHKTIVLNENSKRP